MAKSEECVISDSALCKWLDKDCKDCYIKDLKDNDEIAGMLANFEVTLSLLPDNFDDLQSEECQFCKKEDKNKRHGYALIDLAHSEPEQKKGMFFGFGKKVRQKIGSLMPLSISICKECRRTLRFVESIKWISIIVFLGLAIVVQLTLPVGDKLSEISVSLPYGMIILGALIGYIAGKVASNAYMKAKSDETCFNVFEIPVCEDMRDRGWFLMQDNGEITRFIFSKKSNTNKVKDILEPMRKEQG